LGQNGEKFSQKMRKKYKNRPTGQKAKKIV